MNDSLLKVMSKNILISKLCVHTGCLITHGKDWVINNDTLPKLSNSTKSTIFAMSFRNLVKLITPALRGHNFNFEIFQKANLGSVSSFITYPVFMSMHKDLMDNFDWWVLMRATSPLGTHYAWFLRLLSQNQWVPKPTFENRLLRGTHSDEVPYLFIFCLVHNRGVVGSAVMR